MTYLTSFLRGEFWARGTTSEPEHCHLPPKNWWLMSPRRPSCSQAPSVSCQGGQITLVDLADGFRHGELATEPGNWIWSMCSLPMPGGDPDLLACAASDHLVRFWDPPTRRPVSEPLASHAGQVRAVAAVGRQDGATLLASGGTDGNVCLWHPDSRKLVRTIPIGVPICNLVGDIGDPAALRRTDGGAMLMLGTERGIMAIDLSAKLFTPT